MLLTNQVSHKFLVFTIECSNHSSIIPYSSNLIEFDFSRLYLQSRKYCEYFNLNVVQFYFSNKKPWYILTGMISLSIQRLQE